MMYFSLALVAALHWKLSQSLALDVRDDPHDRGIWNLDCGKAAGACNNACYNIYCLKQATDKIIYDGGEEDSENRKRSGCEDEDGHSVCRKAPFSQKLNDPQELDKGSCDEWPMADVKQDDKFKNSLRCINQGENSCE